MITRYQVQQLLPATGWVAVFEDEGGNREGEPFDFIALATYDQGDGHLLRCLSQGLFAIRMNGGRMEVLDDENQGYCGICKAGDDMTRVTDENFYYSPHWEPRAIPPGKRRRRHVQPANEPCVPIATAGD